MIRALVGPPRSPPVMAEKKGGQMQQYVEGETNLWGQPLAEDTKANFAKADQIRKDFDMRNNKQTWFGPMADRPGVEVASEKSAAQLRADFMARNGQTEWLDVMSNTRLDDTGPGGSPAISAAAPSEATPALTDNQQAAYK